MSCFLQLSFLLQAHFVLLHYSVTVAANNEEIMMQGSGYFQSSCYSVRDFLISLVSDGFEIEFINVFSKLVEVLFVEILLHTILGMS